MGISDYKVFPIHTDYMLRTLSNKLDVCKKIAWIGQQHQYAVQLNIANRYPHIEHFFYDIVADDAPNCFKLDINSKGWGAQLRNEGVNIMTLFRVSVYALDHDAFLNELVEFVSDGASIIFEDCQPTATGLEENFYRGKSCFKLNKPFTMLTTMSNVLHEEQFNLPDGRWFKLNVLSKKVS